MTKPDFSSSNRALRVVKAMPESDELHADLTRHYDKSLVSASLALHGVYLTWKYPRRRIEATFQVTNPDFSSPTGDLCAVKVTQENNKSHAELTRP